MKEDLSWIATLQNWIFKFLIPALMGVSINLAINSRKKTMSAFNVITSVVVGICMAWLLSGIVFHYFSEMWQPPMIAAAAISGEKIATWLIFKFNIDQFATKFIDFLIEWYRK